jgi:excisionase family DNA binding protein
MPYGGGMSENKISEIVRALTTVDVAERLNVQDYRVRDLARRKMIPFFRVGRQLRFDARAIENWIAGGGSELPGGWRREAR